MTNIRIAMLDLYNTDKQRATARLDSLPDAKAEQTTLANNNDDDDDDNNGEGEAASGVPTIDADVNAPPFTVLDVYSVRRYVWSIVHKWNALLTELAADVRAAVKIERAALAAAKSGQRVRQQARAASGAGNGPATPHIARSGANNDDDVNAVGNVDGNGSALAARLKLGPALATRSDAGRRTLHTLSNDAGDAQRSSTNANDTTSLLSAALDDAAQPLARRSSRLRHIAALRGARGSSDDSALFLASPPRLLLTNDNGDETLSSPSTSVATSAMTNSAPSDVPRRRRAETARTRVYSDSPAPPRRSPSPSKLDATADDDAPPQPTTSPRDIDTTPPQQQQQQQQQPMSPSNATTTTTTPTVINDYPNVKPKEKPRRSVPRSNKGFVFCTILSFNRAT
jgi:hypothetical protein